MSALGTSSETGGFDCREIYKFFRVVMLVPHIDTYSHKMSYRGFWGNKWGGRGHQGGFWPYHHPYYPLCEQSQSCPVTPKTRHGVQHGLFQQQFEQSEDFRQFPVELLSIKPPSTPSAQLKLSERSWVKLEVISLIWERSYMTQGKKMTSKQRKWQASKENKTGYNQGH